MAQVSALLAVVSKLFLCVAFRYNKRHRNVPLLFVSFSFICVEQFAKAQRFAQKESSESSETVKSINENRIKIHVVCLCVCAYVQNVQVARASAHTCLSPLPDCHLFTCTQTNYT